MWLSLFCYALLCVHSSNHLEEEEKAAGCFAFIVLQMYCYYKCSATLPWAGVQCVIVVFPDNNCLLFVLTKAHQ